MGGKLGFLYRQLSFKPKPLPASVRLDGKTVIITGASTGLGLEAAKQLAAHGAARIILAARNPQKAEGARKVVAGQNAQCDVRVWDLDYDSFASIRAFGQRASTELDRLDTVILSAGVKNLEYVVSETGHEAQVQVNHLGTAALSLELLGLLRRTAKRTGEPGRLTLVSSETHFWTPFAELRAAGDGKSIFARLDEPGEFKANSMERYNTSKLLNVLWVRELAQRVPAEDVVINTVNPGLCASELHRSHKEAEGFNKVFAWTAEQGGHNLADAATRHAKDHGAYLSVQEVTK